MAAALPFIPYAIAAVGALSQGQAASNQAKTQADINLQQSRGREDDFRREQSRVAASRRAALGASGADPSTGSPLLVSEDFAGEVELQAQRIRQGGEVSSSFLRQQAKAAQTGGFFRSGSLLLTGAGKQFAGGTT